MIFNFATFYCNTHPVITDLQKFRLSDQEYRQFEAWLNEQHFVYTTDLEKQAANLVTTAKHERYYNELQNNLDILQSKIQQNHSLYLERFRSEIQIILEEEIAFHYALNKGKSEVSLTRDKEIAEAKKVLHDTGVYQKLLTPH
jgi:carboxyl-terminal processing protease